MPPKNLIYCPNLCKKVATHFLPKSVLKVAQDFVNNFSEILYCSNFSQITAIRTKLLKFLRKMLISRVHTACYTVSLVLNNLNVGGPTEIVYNIFCLNYEILLPTAG